MAGLPGAEGPLGRRHQRQRLEGGADRGHRDAVVRAKIGERLDAGLVGENIHRRGVERGDALDLERGRGAIPQHQHRRGAARDHVDGVGDQGIVECRAAAEPHIIGRDLDAELVGFLLPEMIVLHHDQRQISEAELGGHPHRPGFGARQPAEPRRRQHDPNRRAADHGVTRCLQPHFGLLYQLFECKTAPGKNASPFRLPAFRRFAATAGNDAPSAALIDARSWARSASATRRADNRFAECECAGTSSRHVHR